MERLWTFGRLAVTMRRVDFLDPVLAGQPHARERGVRVEIKPAQARSRGSVYASDVVTLDQALCRCDFLESGPGKADRMHWHPDMADGEPGDRRSKRECRPTHRLVDLLPAQRTPAYLRGSGHDITSYTDDLAEMGDTATRSDERSMRGSPGRGSPGRTLSTTSGGWRWRSSASLPRPRATRASAGAEGIRQITARALQVRHPRCRLNPQACADVRVRRQAAV